MGRWNHTSQLCNKMAVGMCVYWHVKEWGPFLFVGTLQGDEEKEKWWGPSIRVLNHDDGDDKERECV